MANLSGLRHFLRDVVNMNSKEAAGYVRSVRKAGVNTPEQETELVNHLSAKYNVKGGEHFDTGLSQEVYNALGAQPWKFNGAAVGDGLGGRVWNAGALPYKLKSQRKQILETRQGILAARDAADPAGRLERYAGNKEGIIYSDAQIKSIERKAAKLRGEKRLGSEYTEEMGTMSAQQREIQAANQRKNAEDLKNGWHKEAPSDVLEAEEDIASNIRGSNASGVGDRAAQQASLDAEIGAANPLGTQASREAEIAEAKARMAEQGAVTGSRKDGKGFFNSVKSSVANMKAKYNQATEALYDIAGKNHTPTEFQQQTTAMVGKFSGGKWTGGVNTEKMNWLEANAHENLYSSVGRDYDNLIAKMQGAKTQEEFSKLMEDHHIKYSEGMSGAELNKNINAHFNERIDGGPGVGNYIVGNKAASGAMLGVSGASVLALSDSRGSRSNSQLYSSQI